MPALPDAECRLARNPRRLKCPAPGTSAPHSTRRRVGRCHLVRCRWTDGWITNSADVRIAVSVRAGMSPDTKKRRILWIVVSLYQPLFQPVMLLDYQMELNFASGLLSRECWLEENVVEINGIFAV